MYANFHRNILQRSIDRPFSLFQNLELGKASTDKKCQFAISWARSCQYQCLRKSLSKYSTQFKRQGHFHFFRIWRSAKPRGMINVILQFLGLDLFNTKLSAKFYQNFSNGLRVNFHYFQNLNLGKISTNPKCHLTISWATSCQIPMCMQTFITIFHTSTDRAIFTFSEFGARQNLDRRKNDISQSLGLDLDNINVYAEVYQNIFHSVQEIRPFSLFFRIWRSAKPRPMINVVLQ